MSSTLKKIRTADSTGLSLNERFTAISSQAKLVTNIGSRSRSRSVQRQIPTKNETVSSRANQLLLAHLQRKHEMPSALKLKRTNSSGNLASRLGPRRPTTSNVNNRSRSRNHNRHDFFNNISARRSRSRSHSRGRPGQNNRQRNASLTRRGVQWGRVQKRHNSTNINGTRDFKSDNYGRGRPRSGQQMQQGVGQQQQQQQIHQRKNRAVPRGSNIERRGSNGKGQTQQRRGRSRSRSRTRRGSNGRSNNQGNKSTSTKPAINKADLDKELDQYMASAKTENEMDYSLKNKGNSTRDISEDLDDLCDQYTHIFQII